MYTLCAQNWQWAKSYGGTQADEAGDIISDNLGNVYSVISITGTVTVGSNTFVCKGSDIAITKHNTVGQLQWARHIAGIGNGYGGIELDNSGGLYIYGYFDGLGATLYFPTDTLISAGQNDVFMAKYDVGGNFKWAKPFGGTGSDLAGSIKFSPADNALVFSLMYSGNVQIGTTTYVPKGGYDIALAKCDTAGNIVWVETVAGPNSEFSGDIGFDNVGNLYFVGSFFSDTITFSGVLPGTLNNLAGGSEMFFVKYSAGGNILWVKGAGGSGFASCSQLIVDAAGYFYLSGIYKDNTIFGQITLPPSPGNHSGYILKMSAGGAFVWAQAFTNSPSTPYVPDITLNNSADLFVVGYFKDIFYVDSVIIRAQEPSVLTGYVIKMDSAGDFNWYKKIVNNPSAIDYDTWLGAIHFDAFSNSVYVAGAIKGQVPFGSTMLSVGTVASDAVIAKLQDCIPPDANAFALGPTSFCQEDSTKLITYNTGPGYSYQWVGNGIEIIGATTTSFNPNLTGAYSVIISDANGCSSVSAIIPIIIWPPAVADVDDTTVYGTICSIDSVRIDALPAFSYKWLRNDTAIMGATNISCMATLPGKYSVVVSNNMGCMDTSSYEIVTLGPALQLQVSKNDSVCLGSSINLTASGASSYNWQPATGLNDPTSPAPIASPSVNTTYTVIGTTNTCKDTGYVTVSVFTLPMPPNVTFLGWLLSSDSINNIQWNLNGNPVPGATFTPYTPTQNGWYTVTYTDANGCSATSSSVYVVVSVEEYVLGVDYSVFPNPFSDAVTISFVREIRNGNLFLYDMISTRTIFEESINGNSVIIQREKLAAGMYFFRIIDENNISASGKIIAK